MRFSRFHREVSGSLKGSMECQGRFRGSLWDLRRSQRFSGVFHGGVLRGCFTGVFHETDESSLWGILGGSQRISWGQAIFRGP